MSLPLDIPVRLKSEFAGVYSLAPAGALARARRRKLDEGFPMVYIEWDKEHWSYSGEQDKWTFENHFEPVEEESSTVGLPPELQQGIEKLFAEYTGAQADGAKESEAPDSQLFDLDTREEYERLAKLTSKAAEQGVAFVLLGVQEVSNEDEKAFVPFVVQSYTDEVAGVFLETQLADFASSAYRNSVVELIRRLRQDQDEGPMEGSTEV